MSVLAARAGMMMQRSAQDRRKSEMSSGVCSPEVTNKLGCNRARRLDCSQVCLSRAMSVLMRPVPRSAGDHAAQGLGRPYRRDMLDIELKHRLLRDEAGNAVVTVLAGTIWRWEACEEDDLSCLGNEGPALRSSLPLA